MIITEIITIVRQNRKHIYFKNMYNVKIQQIFLYIKNLNKKDLEEFILVSLPLIIMFTTVVIVV